jgi:hypothetical protein
MSNVVDMDQHLAARSIEGLLAYILEMEEVDPMDGFVEVLCQYLGFYLANQENAIGALWNELNHTLIRNEQSQLLVAGPVILTHDYFATQSDGPIRECRLVVARETDVLESSPLVFDLHVRRVAAGEYADNGYLLPGLLKELTDTPLAEQLDVDVLIHTLLIDLTDAGFVICGTQNFPFPEMGIRLREVRLIRNTTWVNFRYVRVLPD